MSKCPKCGSCKIIGPKYESGCDTAFGKAGSERLRYTCFQCGYSETTPTNDATTESKKARP